VFGEDEMPAVSDYPANTIPQILRRPDGQGTLEYLRRIFLFDERAHFDWIVTPASALEIDAGRDSHRSRYLRDVMEHSEACLNEAPPGDLSVEMVKFITGRSCGYLCSKDRALLSEAATLECDTFLTIEKRLPGVSHLVLQQVPLWITTPEDLWNKLASQIRGL
jgi:hypothetical protein